MKDEIKWKNIGSVTQQNAFLGKSWSMTKIKHTSAYPQFSVLLMTKDRFFYVTYDAFKIKPMTLVLLVLQSFS